MLSGSNVLSYPARLTRPWHRSSNGNGPPWSLPVLFRWQAGDPLWPGASYSRADASPCATEVSASGLVTTVAANVLRNSHYVGGVGPCVLLEGSRKNLVVQSEVLDNASGGWSQNNLTSDTGGQADPKGGTSAYALLGNGGGSSSISRTVAFTGDGTKAVSCFIKPGTGGKIPEVAIFDNTASTTRCRVRADFSAGGAPTLSITAGAGTIFGSVACTGGWYRILFAANSIVAANSNSIFCYTVVGAAADTNVFFGPMAEDAAFPSSYIATGASAVTRAADSLRFPFSPVPQAMTVYAKFFELGDTTTTGGVCAIGDSTNEALFLYGQGGGAAYQVIHRRAGDVASTAGSTASFGDSVELGGAMFADGSVQLSQSLNAGVISTASQSAANAVSGSFSSALLRINGRTAGTTDGFAAFQSIKILAGVQSLAACRAA